MALSQDSNIEFLGNGNVEGKMSKRRLISFDWAMKKLLRRKANFEILMKGNPQMALKLLRLFTKRIYV